LDWPGPDTEDVDYHLHANGSMDLGATNTLTIGGPFKNFIRVPVRSFRPLNVVVLRLFQATMERSHSGMNLQHKTLSFTLKERVENKLCEHIMRPLHMFDVLPKDSRLKTRTAVRNLANPSLIHHIDPVS